MLKVANSVISASRIATPITLPGDVTLSTGNLVIGTSGKGIDFTVTTSGSGTMTSELLADYEEGDWTPTQGSGLTVVGTFSSSGTYTKIGRLVVVTFRLRGTTSVAALAGYDITTNLPFTVGGTPVAGIATNGSPSISVATLSITTSVYAAEAIAATPDINGSISYRV